MHNIIAFTNDGGNSFKHAITPSGITGDYIIGKLGAFAQVRANQIIVGDSGEKISDDLLNIPSNLMETGKIYNGVKIDAADGLTITRTDQKANVLLNATSGIKIQKGDGVGGFTNSLFADSEGNLTLAGKVVIGTGNSTFKADTNGIYLGSSAFDSAPFKVDLGGKLTASNAAITGSINCTGLTIAGTDVLNQVSAISSSISGSTLSTSTGGISKISGNIQMGAGSSISWGEVNTPLYSDINGTKPPTDADNTTGNVVNALKNKINMFTYIDQNTIYSPKIEGCEIIGQSLTATGTNGTVKIDPSNGWLEFLSGSTPVGKIHYMNIDDKWGDSDKLYLHSAGALKLDADNGISLNAGSTGDVWITGDIHLLRQGSTVYDYYGNAITGSCTAKFG